MVPLKFMVLLVASAHIALARSVSAPRLPMGRPQPQPQQLEVSSTSGPTRSEMQPIMSGIAPLGTHNAVVSHAAAAGLPTKHGYHPTATAVTACHAAAQALIAQHLRTNTFRPAALKGERKTVLLKSNGQVVTRTWTWEGASAARRKTVRLSASAGEQAFATQPNNFPSLAATPVCDGCIGVDTRNPVLPAASSTFPHTAIGQLTAETSGGGGEWCTGAMISPIHVLTAAHCVFDVATTHAAVSNIQFNAGCHGTAFPFGSVPFRSVRLLAQFQSQTSYDDTAANNDFAVITLQQPLGQKTGWLGLEWTNQTQVSVDLTTVGYPADKPAGSMWNTSCAGTDFYNTDPTNNLVQHTCDSTHGQSGSPMFDAANNIRAVLTGGNDAGINWALQINEFVFFTILGWMQEDGEFKGVGTSTTELADKSGAAAASGGTK